MTKRKIAVALVTAVASFPTAAYASPDGPRPSGRSHDGAAQTSQRSRPTTNAPTVRIVDASDGFDWGAAGIGAAAMASLLCVLTGAFIALGGRRHPRASS